MGLKAATLIAIVCTAISLVTYLVGTAGTFLELAGHGVRLITPSWIIYQVGHPFVLIGLLVFLITLYRKQKTGA
jgi:hypothetical protein